MRSRVDGDTLYLEDDAGNTMLTARREGDIVTLRNGDWSLIKDTKAEHDHVLARHASTDRSIKFRFYGVTLELRSDMPYILDDFGSMYRRFAEDFDGSADMTIHALRVTNDAACPFVLLMQPRPGLRLKGDFCAVSYLMRAEDLLLQVHNESEVFVLMNNPDYAFIHGATVERDGVGYVMPAESGRGKTTLTLALLNAGYRFMSDEYAVLDSRTHSLLPFPRTLSVRSGSLRLFPHLERARADLPTIVSQAEILYSIDPASVLSCETGEPCPVGYIVFPRYDPVKGPALIPISRMEAMRRLVSTRSYLSLGLLDKQPAMDLMLSVISRADCFELLTADPGKTVDSFNSL